MTQGTTKQPSTKSTLYAKRDKHGILRVPVYVSNSYRVLVAFTLSFSGVSFAGIGILFFVRRGIHLGFFSTDVFLVMEGFAFIALGLRTLWLWHKLHRLTPTNVLCQRFGVDVEQLKRIVVENGIRPDANVAGQDYFHAADFGDITTLLRASAQPLAAPDTLLRSAANMQQETGEQLLRAKA